MIAGSLEPLFFGGFFPTFSVYIFIKYYYIRSVQKEFMKTHKKAEVIVLLFLLKIFKTSMKVSLLNDLSGIVALS